MHVTWENKILGFSMLMVDEFIDFPKDYLDTARVKEAVISCVGDLGKLDYYVKCMSMHDAWREAGCVFYYYILKKYGLRGLRVAVLHAIMDLLAMNISSIGVADIVTFDHVDSFFDTIARYDFIPSDLLFLRKAVKNNLTNIVEDIMREKNLFKFLGKIDPRSVVKITVYYNPAVWSINDSDIQKGLEEYYRKIYGDSNIAKLLVSSIKDHYKRLAEGFHRIKALLREASNLDVEVEYVNILDLEPEEAERIVVKTWEIALMTRVSTKYSNKHNVAEFDMDHRVLDLPDGYLLIVKYRDGSEMFYPHYIKRSGISKRIKVSAEDFLASLLLG